MSVARCCCAIVSGCLTCNVLGTIYTAALALVDYACTPFADETDWTDVPFSNDSDDLIDNATVVCNSVGKANANVAGNYWEAFSSSNGFDGVVSSTCRPNYNVTEAEYPNEWDVCANNTVEGLFTLGIIADQASMPTTGGYDAFPEVEWTVTITQGTGISNEVAHVTLTTTMDRDANTYSSKVTVTELTRDDDQAGGSTTSTVATDYALASTASSHSGSVKFKVTPITPTYTDTVYGLVDKWKLEYTVVIGGVSVAIPDFEFTQLVRDAAGDPIGLNPFAFQQGNRYSSTYWKNHFKVRYTDVSAVLSHTAPYTGDSVPLCSLCNKPLCWFDSFASYTTGDDLVDIVNPPYSDTLISETNAIVSASDTLLISPVATDESICGIDRSWGVDSDGVDADFLQGAANKSVFSVDLLDLDTTQEGAVLDRPRVLIGPQSIGVQHAIEFIPNTGPFADPDKTDRNFVYKDGTSTRRVSIDTLTAPEDLYPVNYKVHIFDGTKISPSTYSFGWEVLFDDVVVASSTDSGNVDLHMSVTDEFVAGDGWCLDPTFRIKIDPSYDYTVMEIDNFFVGINGDTSCLP